MLLHALPKNEIGKTNCKCKIISRTHTLFSKRGMVCYLCCVLSSNMSRTLQGTLLSPFLICTGSELFLQMITNLGIVLLVWL